MPVIEINNLTKTFGRVVALDGFNMTVERGQIAAFLGPNGAGKSTAIRVLLGLLRAGSGTAALFDRNPWTDAVDLHSRLAYVPGDVSLWPSLTGGEAIDVLSRLGKRHDERRRAELIEKFELDPTRKCRTYSKGNRQKVALIAALACDVDLYVFDEPTSGLDPLMEKVFQGQVKELRRDDRTVLLSSHILAQVEKLCDTVTIIRAGRAVQSGSLADLQHLHRMRVTATVTGNPSVLNLVPGIHHLEVDGQRVSFSVDREQTELVMRSLADLGVTESTWTPPSLEDVFISEYSEAPK